MSEHERLTWWWSVAVAFTLLVVVWIMTWEYRGAIRDLQRRITILEQPQR